MAELTDVINEELEQLKMLRDELRVKVHLGKMEVQERWDLAEKRWHELEGKLKLIQKESEKGIQDVSDAARELAHEISEAYRHIRTLI